MTSELERVVEIVCRIGSVTAVGADQDFYEAGVSSIAALSLLMELESEFAISISDDEFVKARTPRALCEMVERLRNSSAV